MSTAESTAKEVPQNVPELTAADFADILSTTLAMAAEVGLSVGVRNRTGDTAGLLIFVSGLGVDETGRLIVVEAAA